jgi:hypothetical protein
MSSEAARIYLAHAIECEDRAFTASDESSRRTFREAARLWVHIAEHAEYLSRRVPTVRAIGSADRDPH